MRRLDLNIGRDDQSVSLREKRRSEIRHAVLGAGGIGTLVAGCLAKRGFPVTVIVRNESIPTFPKQLWLEGPFGNFRVTVDCASSITDAEVVWVAVKATQLTSALTRMKNVDPVRAIVPLLNGIEHLQLLESKYGDDRVIAATIAVESQRVACGHVVQRSPFARLNVLSKGRELLEYPMNGLRDLGFTCQFVDSEPTLMWSKLVFLAPFALATTAATQTKGELLTNARLWKQAQQCVHEACAVARAEGASVDPKGVIATIAALPDGMRSSMQKDVEHGILPELDAIGGAILRAAARHGLETPATRSLMVMVEQRVLQVGRVRFRKRL